MTAATAHPIFYQSLRTLDDAKALLTYLNEHGLLYHCEDDALEIESTLTGERLFTKPEATALNIRINECYSFDWAEDGCPCGFCMALLEGNEGAS